MALLFYDGFESGEIETPWIVDANVTVSASWARTGGYGMRVEDTFGNEAELNFSLAANDSTIIIGFANKPDLLDYGIFFAIRIGVADWLSLRRTVTGVLELHRGGAVSSIGLIASAPAGTLVDGVWHYIEFKTWPDSATGQAIVRVDGVEVISFTGQTLNTGSPDTTDREIRWVVGNSDGDTIIDDVYVCDTVGPDNNDFLGDVQVERMAPTADDTANFVGSDADSVDNFALVDEVPAAGADYVESDTVGNDDRYTMSDRTLTGAIIAVKPIARALKDDANPRGIKLIVESGATTDTSADMPLAEGSKYFEKILIEDPDTSAAWTTSGVNALIAGVEVGS